ncbi:bifunctional Ribosomal protein L35A/Translation protein [Babesia duncani]|uniref:Bifunctional Ribosomal protein L35A/Translation protein n=1 Tax=Babesia duncani TaxID=323732 RepID=A0AAD9UNP0_9APIC|nr:bifunctional Ribosomal protein L35A/Translation protein [Babesia duncani]
MLLGHNYCEFDIFVTLFRGQITFSNLYIFLFSFRKMAKTGKKEPCRLYTRAIVLGYKRSKVNQDQRSSLLKLEGVVTREDTGFYLGKRVAYVYKCKNVVKGTKYRAIWGKIRRPHGNGGVVRATFKHNLPPCAMGGRVRVFLYPSHI